MPASSQIVQTCLRVAKVIAGDCASGCAARMLPTALSTIVLIGSAKTGAGVDALIDRLSAAASKLAGEPALVTHARQRKALAEAASCLKALEKPEIAGCEELFAEELRLAADCLGRITGKIGIEDVLGEIFKNFCVGK